MSTAGFGALGEYALGETGERNDTLVRPNVITGIGEVLQAQTFTGQSNQRSTFSSWGDGALGEYALGEGPSTSSVGAIVDVSNVIEGTGATLNPVLVAGKSVLPNVVTGLGETLSPAVRSGKSVLPNVITGLGETLNPSLNISATVIVSNVITGVGQTLNPAANAGASIFPARYLIDRFASWGDGALGEYALGEGPPLKGLAFPITGVGEVLQPVIVAGKSVLPNVITGLGQALSPAVRAGKSVLPNVITGLGETLNPTIKISVSILPNVITGVGSVLNPMVSAGKSVMPNVITGSGYTLNPETAARRRRVWQQAIAS